MRHRWVAGPVPYLIAVAELVAVVVAPEKPPEEGGYAVEVAVGLDGFVEGAELDFVEPERRQVHCVEPPVAQVELDWHLE